MRLSLAVVVLAAFVCAAASTSATARADECTSCPEGPAAAILVMPLTWLSAWILAMPQVGFWDDALDPEDPLAVVIANAAALGVGAATWVLTVDRPDRSEQIGAGSAFGLAVGFVGLVVTGMLALSNVDFPTWLKLLVATPIAVGIAVGLTVAALDDTPPVGGAPAPLGAPLLALPW